MLPTASDSYFAYLKIFIIAKHNTQTGGTLGADTTILLQPDSQMVYLPNECSHFTVKDTDTGNHEYLVYVINVINTSVSGDGMSWFASGEYFDPQLNT
ncbi:MAG: hypothetical protein QM652_07585 [Legionella sp.]|uniref:hypothetical protein n=1 Tax=Legionella sp. TaxID=459 RepID=UPI0039E6AE46